MRERLLSLCAALWGLAIAIALLPRWTGPAPPGQLPGFATSSGFDARAPFCFVAGVIVLPIAAAFLMRPLIAKLAAPEARAWARNTAAVSMLVPLLLVAVDPDLLDAVAPTAITVLLCSVLRALPARFTRRDLILVPTAAAVFLAIVDLTELDAGKQIVLAAAVVLAARLAIVPIRSGRALPAATCFALSPLALVFQTRVVSCDHRHFGWTPLAVAIVTPFLFRALVTSTPAVRRRLRQLVVYAVFPIAAYSYLSATSLTTAEGKPRLSLFEEAHHLVPASEVLNGATLYRDVIPAHGLIQDGLLDVLLLRTGPVTTGRSMRGRNAISALNSVASYALAAAVTGSPEAGIAAFFLGAPLRTAGGSTRMLPALLSLALMVAAARRRNPRLLAWAGAGVILTGLTSIDHGIYSLIALLFATTRLKRGWRFAATGLLAAAVPVVLAMIGAGILVPFVRTSVLEVATLGPVYTLAPFDPPLIFAATVHRFPELLAATYEHGAELYLAWIAALLFVAVALTSRPPGLPRRRARHDALLTLAVWIVVVAISYAERHHFHFQTAVPALLVGGAMVTAARWRWVPLAAVALLLAIARPAVYLEILTALRHARGPLSVTDSAQLSVPPRARDVLWTDADAAVIRGAGAYIDRLAPGDTFFDFTNHGLLYFLFDRRCPVRQVEVAFYEREDRQREVIDRLERNPRVVAALVPSFPQYGSVDLVPNATRAPLVWKYLQDHFRPDYQEGDVVFWRRK